MKFLTTKNLVAIIFSIVVLSNTFATEKDEFIFSQLTIKDGLSQSTIFTMLQDQKGFMWFGTANGLNKYDGYNFTVYSNNPGDSTSISDNGITALHKDDDGHIWIGTVNGGLNKFDRKSEKFSSFKIFENDSLVLAKEVQYYEYPLSVSRNNDRTITSIAEDEEKNLWIGSWGSGIAKYNPFTHEIKRFYHEGTNPRSLASNRVMKILIDSQGIIWIGTFGGGLDRVDFVYPNNSSRNNNLHLAEIFVHFSNDDTPNYNLSNNKIITLYEDKEQNLWIGTFHGGLNKLTAEQKSLQPHEVSFSKLVKKENDSFSLSNNTVMSISEDGLGYLWIGTFGGGLNRLDKKTGKVVHFRNEPFNDNSLSDNDILSLYTDDSGILWIGSHLGKGLNKLELHEIKFHHLKYSPIKFASINDEVVWSIEQDNEDNLWIGTYRGGLNKLNRKTNGFKFYKHSAIEANSIADNHIRSLINDGKGNLWIGTYSGGLDRFDKKTEIFYNYKHDPNDPFSIGSNQIQAIHIDSRSTFWIGAFGGGLNKFQYSENLPDGKIKFKRFVHDPSNPLSISDNRVYSLCEDRTGILWIGTFGGGLNKFDKKSETFIQYRHDPIIDGSLGDDRVMAIHEDSNGTLWIATYGGGLNKFDRKKNVFYKYVEEDGFNSYVYGVLEDNNGDLWMSTDQGIFKMDVSNEIFTQYDIRDGVQSMEFSGGAYFKNEDGELFLGGINGLNYFFPDSINYSSYLPPVVITSIQVFNKAQPGERDILELSYDENFFSFEFAALEYSHPEDIQYTYILEGLENDWHFTDAKNKKVNYTNLSPGEYVFKVKGTNKDGVWNPEYATLKINIHPLFWQTWWFILLIIVLIGASVYYFIATRIRNLFAIEKLKAKLAADLHDNIGSGLTEISILSELSAADEKNVSKSVSQNLVNISETARQLVDNMSDIVWVINPKRDSLHDLIIRLKDSYSDFLSHVGISFKTNNLDKLKNIKLPMEYRQNLYLIFKEGINNCIKHSQCHRILLKTSINEDKLEISLKDDGIGIDENAISNGNGLRNIKSRASLIGGEMFVKSNPDKGTTLCFKGKFNGMHKFNYLFKKRG